MNVLQATDNTSNTQGFLLVIIIVAFTLFSISGIYSFVHPIVANAVCTLRPNLIGL